MRRPLRYRLPDRPERFLRFEEADQIHHQGRQQESETLLTRRIRSQHLRLRVAGICEFKMHFQTSDLDDIVSIETYRLGYL